MKLLDEKIYRARLQIFRATFPGDRRISQMIQERGVLDTAQLINEREGEIDPAEIHQKISEVGGTFLTPECRQWPIGLADLSSPPVGLIVKGALPQHPMIALVGTRNPTHYGIELARNFASGFADHGWTIVSGGALGIDTEAHQSALAVGGETVAVLASGVDINYPASNEKLFNEISINGALISEAMPGVAAKPEKFLIRNRIIAAMTSATIVIEAASRSGSLRTARDAAELLRPVFALPGAITSPMSDGCHQLIAERCAEIITSFSDALELLGVG
jgi:DNA processing protein